MKSDATTVEEYLDSLPPDRREALTTVRGVINDHLPEGYVEQMEWGVIAWVVPLEEYPDTYNKRPLMYVGLSSQKNYMAFYLLGPYSEGPEEAWFRQQYADRGMRLDMGKSCVRFRNVDEVPLDVLGEVVAMVPPAAFIDRYEASRKR